MLKIFRFLCLIVFTSPVFAFNAFDPAAPGVIGNELIKTIPPIIETAKLGPCGTMLDDGSTLVHEVYSADTKLNAHKAAVKWAQCKDWKTEIVIEFLEEYKIRHVGSVSYSLEGQHGSYELSLAEAKELAEHFKPAVEKALSSSSAQLPKGYTFKVKVDPAETLEHLRKLNHLKGYTVKILLQKTGK